MQTLAKRARFEVSQKKSNNMSCVVLAEEYKTGLKFETGASFNDALEHQNVFR